MKLKGLNTHGLCDSCGSFVWLGAACIRKGLIFCNVPCSVHRTIVWRCSECNKPLSDIADHWTTQGESAFVSVYCSAECEGKSLERSCGRVWISVESGTPEVHKLVLLNVLGLSDLWPAGVYRGYLYAPNKDGLYGWWVEGLSVRFEGVTHWQPLPEPPIVEPKQKQVGRCKDCRHWDTAPLYGNERAVCRVLTYSASPYVQNQSNLQGETKRFFVTHRDFGCTEFQPEGEE